MLERAGIDRPECPTEAVSNLAVLSINGSAERIRGQVAADGGGTDGTDYWEATASLKADIEALAGRDILLRDPETGLVDFPGRRDGRRIFLCWRLGEDHVSHWHDLESGFAGRKPL